MSAPLKPWERAGVNSQNSSQNLGNQFTGNVPSCCQPGGGGPQDPLNQPGFSQAPPPIPPRPAQQTSLYNSYSNYGGSYNSYGGLGSYGGFGTGGIYSQYGSGLYGSSMYGNSMYGGIGMNRFGQDPNNSFVRMAEENSRQAFQSIEGIVQAFGSVSMMLESTYSAVYNSFRAVIGVADHFSRMRNHFAQIFSALAIIRTLKWLLRKVLTLMRLRKAMPNDELWMEAAACGLGAAGKLPDDKKPTTSWPLLLFFAVIVGGPWLIWRFLSSLASQSGTAWATGEDDHFVALAEYTFEGQSEEELNFKEGQRIFIAPKELQPRMRGWLLGAIDGKTGIIPAAYVKILGRRRGTKHSPNVSQPHTPQESTGPAPLPQPNSTRKVNSNSGESGNVGSQALTSASSSPNHGTLNCCTSPDQSSKSTCGAQAMTSKTPIFESAFNEINTNETLEFENNLPTTRRTDPHHLNVNDKEAVDILSSSDDIS